MEFLPGYKTYILAILGGAVVAAKLAGLIDEEMATTILAGLGFGTAATLRAGVAKSQKTRRFP